MKCWLHLRLSGRDDGNRLDEKIVDIDEEMRQNSAVNGNTLVDPVPVELRVSAEAVSQHIRARLRDLLRRGLRMSICRPA